MPFGFENTSLLYGAIVVVPLISIILSKKSDYIAEVFSAPDSILKDILHGLSLFCSTFLIVLITVFPFFYSFPWLVLFSLLLNAIALTVFKKRSENMQFMDFFAGSVPPPSRVLISVTLIVFLGLFQLTALIYAGVLFGRYFFEGSLYPVIVLNIVIAGFVVLVGDFAVIAVNNIVLGLLSVITILSLFFLSGVAPVFASSVSEILIIQSRLFFSFGRSELFSLFLPIGILFLVWWIWILDDEAPRQTKLNSHSTLLKTIVAFFIIIFSLVLLVFIKENYTINVEDQFGVSNLNSFMLPAMILLSVLMIGAMTRTFYLIKRFSVNISFRPTSNSDISEKDILIGRLAIAAFAISAILLYPIVIILGERMMMLNLTFTSCFIVPIVTVYTLFTLWKGFTTEGISAGILVGIISGGILFIFSVPMSVTGYSEGLDPISISLISFGVTVVSSSSVSLIIDRIKKKAEKIAVPLT